MYAWYVSATKDFSKGLGPACPDSDDIVMVFLSEDGAKAYVENLDLTGLVEIHKILVVHADAEPSQPNEMVGPIPWANQPIGIYVPDLPYPYQTQIIC